MRLSLSLSPPSSAQHRLCVFLIHAIHLIHLIDQMEQIVSRCLSRSAPHHLTDLTDLTDLPDEIDVHTIFLFLTIWLI